MSDAPALVYLEADDEITTAIRRVRAVDARRVVVVAPGRSRATSSAVALRLLARSADEADREIAVVGDPLTRSLAAEAGLNAFASVEDARRAVSPDGAAAGPLPEPQHATIRVVRGASAEETAPTMAGIAAPPSGALDETRARPIARATGRPSPSPRPAPRPRRRSLGLAALLAVVAALLVAGIVAGATLLPAATITLVPASEAVTATYEIRVANPERRGGTVEAAAAVVASGEYEVVERANGVVTFRNFNVGAVEVPAGTLVAAGDQAFETTEAISVPSGSLTGDGTILAGEANAPVIASAPGPGANVDANAIDTVLSQGTAARLRGFPQNTSRLVLNAEPTGGGVARSGPEITEADVEEAVTALRSDLERLAAAATPDEPNLLVVEASPGETTVDVPDGLAGTRDEAEVEISGARSWEVVIVDPDEVEAEAAARLATDPAVPEGYDLLEESITVNLAEPRLAAGGVVIEATVTGRAAPRPNPVEVIERSRGLSAEEAQLALADLGDAQVDLWPGWVATVPELDWRIEVHVVEVRP